jgi:cholesterol transport system auxiliary component
MTIAAAGTAGTAVRAFALALGVAWLAGCALMTPAQVDAPAAFTLGPLALELPRPARCGSTTLIVFPPQAPSIYATTQMAYTTQPQQIGYFARHEWAEPPPQMLHALLIRALQDTGCFDAVVAPPYPNRYRHALRSELVELLQDFSSQPPTLLLTLRVQLGDDTAGRLVDSKQIAVREPLLQATPEAGAVAANQAAAKALREAVSFVLTATSSSASRP